MRPTGVFKRGPQMAGALYGRYAAMSKADWADAYFDLFRQVFGEDRTDREAMEDAEGRHVILKRYRDAEALAAEAVHSDA